MSLKKLSYFTCRLLTEVFTQAFVTALAIKQMFTHHRRSKQKQSKICFQYWRKKVEHNRQINYEISSYKNNNSGTLNAPIVKMQ